jgi:hypothetical protein
MESRAHLRSAAHWIATCLVLAATTACDDNDNVSPYETSVGLACRGDVDCAPGVSCEHGKEFGDGMCTYPCRDHFDCPGGSACVDVSGGSCLVACVDDSWCNPGFHCKKRGDRIKPGESFVCIK